tara:strand:+ start:8976 stop:9140 length:165 start_codon:yes stop_codon:yes gene_type:complete
MQNELLSAGDYRRKKSAPKRQEEQALRNQRAKLRDIERIKEQLALKAEFKEVWE